jgi:hypothetical protein
MGKSTRGDGRVAFLVLLESVQAGLTKGQTIRMLWDEYGARAGVGYEQFRLYVARYCRAAGAQAKPSKPCDVKAPAPGDAVPATPASNPLYSPAPTPHCGPEPEPHSFAHDPVMKVNFIGAEKQP